MKRSLKNRYHVLIGILFAVIVLETVLLLFSVYQYSDIDKLKSDIQSILIFFIFAQFIYLLIIYNYVPYQYGKALKEIRSLLGEISLGKYNLDIDNTIYDNDDAIQEIIKSIQRMMDIIARFDKLKTDKIYEHDQRIQQILNLSKQGFIVLSITGEIAYVNNPIRDTFSKLTENTNIGEVIYKDEFAAQLIEIMSKSLNYGSNLHDVALADKEGTRKLIINGIIIRDRNGGSNGAVFSIDIIKYEQSYPSSV